LAQSGIRTVINQFALDQRKEIGRQFNINRKGEGA
jgi:hypothetical protein